MEFGFAHPPRSMLARLVRREAEDEDAGAGLEQLAERRHVGRTPGVVEGVEEPAVGDGVEPLRDLADRQRVHLEKVGHHARRLGLRPGDLDRPGQKIHTGHGVAAAGEPDGEVARATARIEHPRADQVAGRHERRLRPADIPGGLRGVVTGKPLSRGFFGHASWAPLWALGNQNPGALIIFDG